MKSSNNNSKYILFTTTFLILTYICINTSYKFTLELKKDILDIKSKSLTGRKLLTNEDANRVCEKASQEVKEYFETGTNPPKEATFDDEKPHIQALIQFIDGNGAVMDVVKKYIKTALPIVLFLVLVPITLILWPVCIFCCICNCCCCCCCKGKKCQKISFLVAVAAFGLVIILCTVEVATTNNIFNNLSTTSCTIFKLITETVEGQPENMPLPKWEGIEGLKGIINEMSHAVDDASEIANSEFAEAQEELEESVEQWNDLMNHEDVNVIQNSEFSYTDYSCTGISDQLYQHITPFITKTYGPVETEDTTLFYANVQFDTVTSNARESIVDASEKMDKALKDGVSTQLIDVENKIDDFGSKFNDLSEKFGDKLLNYGDDVDIYGRKYTKLVFSIIMGLCAILIGLIVLNCIMCCPLACLLRILIHVFWNIMYLLAIVSLLLGTVTGLLGIIGKDGSSIVHYTISQKNLESEKPFLLGTGDVSNYINTCVNGDGNLKEAFDVGEIMDDLDELYKIKDTINEYRKTIKENNTLFTVEYLEGFKNGRNILPMAYYEKLSDNTYELFTKIELALAKLNEKTKNNNVDKLDDLWACKEEDNDGYIYKPKPQTTVTDFHDIAQVKKYLLSLNDGWESNDMDTIYGQFPSIKDTIKKCMNTLNEVQTGMKTLYGVPETSGNVANMNKKLDTQYKTVLNTISHTLNVTIEVLDPLYEVLNQYLGSDSSLYDILNCNFLGNNIKVLLTEMHSGFGKNFYKFGFIMGAIGLLTIIGVYCTILTISIGNTLRKKEKNEENKTELSRNQSANSENRKLVIKENK